MSRIKPARPKAVLSSKRREVSACPLLPAAFGKPAECRGFLRLAEPPLLPALPK